MEDLVALFKLINDILDIPIVSILINIPLAILVSRYFASRKVLTVYSKINHIYPPKKAKRIPQIGELAYKGLVLKQLFKTELTFWSDGNQEIVKESISAKKPLKVCLVNDGLIIKSEVLKISDDACDILLKSETPNSFQIDFDFLNNKEGASIDIFHTEPLKPINWKLKGTKLRSITQLNAFHDGTLGYKITMILYGLYILFTIFINFCLYKRGGDIFDLITGFVYVFIGGAYIVFMFLLKGIPKELCRKKQSKTKNKG